MHTLMSPLPRVLESVKELAPRTTLQMKDWSRSILLCGIPVFARVSILLLQDLHR